MTKAKHFFLFLLLMVAAVGCKRETPVACFTVNPIQASVGDSIIFDMSCSENASFNTWDFGDGTTDGGNELSVIHSFSEAGTYTVTLRTCEHAMWYKWKTRCETENSPKNTGQYPKHICKS